MKIIGFWDYDAEIKSKPQQHVTSRESFKILNELNVVNHSGRPYFLHWRENSRQHSPLHDNFDKNITFFKKKNSFSK